MNTDLLTALITVWLLGVLVGCGLGTWSANHRHAEYVLFLTRHLDRLSAENMEFRQWLSVYEDKPDPADYWKNGREQS